MSVSDELKGKRCVPCEGGVPPLEQDAIDRFLAGLEGWTQKDRQIEKKFVFKNFVEAMAYVNRVADVAESEGHHPDLFIHYKEVTVSLWTHAIGGLSENDFIVAAKVDAL